MNSAVKKLIILQSLLLVGCSSQNLVIDTFIPKPLVKMNENITAKLTLDEQIKNFIFSPEELQKREASIEINFGNTQEKLFENIFSSFFKLDNTETIPNPETKIILIDIKLDKFEYLTPQVAANQKYSVWFKYIINIKDIGRALFSTRYVFALEITALLLTIGVVGAVVLTRRPKGELDPLPDDDPPSI